MAGYELVGAKSGSRLAKAAPPSASGQSFGKGPAIVDHYFQILSFDLEGLFWLIGGWSGRSLDLGMHALL